jgi:hypothetical protein
MKKILASLGIAAASGLGLAGTAQAAPLAPVNLPVKAGGVSIGIGFGGGYAPSGYWATSYRTVWKTWIAGYDSYGQPIWQSGWVTEPYTYWVSTAPVIVGPTFGFGAVFGGSSHHHHHGHHHH